MSAKKQKQLHTPSPLPPLKTSRRPSSTHQPQVSSRTAQLEQALKELRDENTKLSTENKTLKSELTKANFFLDNERQITYELRQSLASIETKIDNAIQKPKAPRSESPHGYVNHRAYYYY